MFDGFMETVSDPLLAINTFSAWTGWNPLGGPVASRLAPTPPGELLLGHVRPVRDRILPAMLEWNRQYGDVVRIRLGHRIVHVLARPEHFEHVLVNNRENYNKASWGYAKLRSILGDGLLTSEGETWTRNRQLQAPIFQPARLAGFADVIVRLTEDVVDRWIQPSRRGKPFNVASEMMDLTLRVVTATILGAQECLDTSSIGEAVSIALHEINNRVFNVLDVPDQVPTPANRRFQQALRTLDAAVMRIIAARRRRPDAPANDFLGMLMAARDPKTGESMNARQLRDEVMTMFLAGHETTANALNWTWLLLSEHADAARKVRAELDRELGERPATFADVTRLSYTRMVLQESMRLYPPVWGLLRSARTDDQIDGYWIPAGSDVLLGIYALHHHPAIWENPQGFDPERFLPERSRDRHKLAWRPFSAGPRACIGAHFAMMEMILILATAMRRCRLDLTPGYPIEPEPVVTLRPKDGLWMTAHPVSAPARAAERVQP